MPKPPVAVELPFQSEQLSADGWLPSARKLPSPNFNARPEGSVVDLLVVHAISLPPTHYGGCFVEDFFCNRLDSKADDYFPGIAEMNVSSHFYIRRNGDLVQFVATGERAWHAGTSSWQGRDNCNDYSIGVELEGCDQDEFEEVQYQCLAGLASLLMKYYPGLAPDRIVGHCDIAPGRKTDPGPLFNWKKLHSKLAMTE